MITEEILINSFNEINQLICNNLNQNFIINSKTTKNDDENLLNWNLNLIAVNELKEHFWFCNLNLIEIDDLVTIDRLVIKENELLLAMKECWENGNLRIEGYEIQDLEQRNSELTLIFDVTASLKVSIPLSPTSSTTLRPWVILEEILPGSLTSTKNAEEVKALRIKVDSLEHSRSVENGEKLRIKERLKKLEDICKTNGYKSLSPTKSQMNDGGTNEATSGSTASQGIRKPPIKRTRRGLSTTEEFEPGVLTDSD